MKRFVLIGCSIFLIALFAMVNVREAEASEAKDTMVVGVSYNSKPGEYVASIEKAENVAMVFPLITTEEEARMLLTKVDALVMTGGNDINPKHYGEEPSSMLGTVYNKRDTSDLLLLKEALKMDIPVLAICRGMQVLNTVQGGTLIQDIPSEVEDSILHRTEPEKAGVYHNIDIRTGSKLANIFSGNIKVYSVHHQAIEKLGSNLTVTATSEDGIIEAVEHTKNSFVLGVQFHPEKYVAYQNGQQIEFFEELENYAVVYREKQLKKMAGAKSTVSTHLYEHDAMKVSWKAVPGASHYTVYYRKTTSKNYTKLTTTDKLYAYKKDSADGVKYYFKVVPHMERNGEKVGSGKYYIDTIYTLKKLKTPKVTRSSTNYVKMTWSGIYGEYGYQISRSTKKTGTYIVSTFKSPSSNKRTLKVTRGRTYYYKIRAYQYSAEGKRVYGPWSNPVSYRLR